MSGLFELFGLLMVIFGVVIVMEVQDKDLEFGFTITSSKCVALCYFKLFFGQLNGEI